MKKNSMLLVLALSITGMVCAQDKTGLTNTDKTFEPPLNSITRRFTVDLGKGNKMQVEMSSMENIEYLLNADSLVNIFLQDIALLKDSLGNDLLSKRIDYVAGSGGQKKIRLQQFRQKGAGFLISHNEIAALKSEQDTVYIAGTVPGYTEGTLLSKREHTPQYYRIGFFINQLAELSGYLDGRLNEKMSAIRKSTSQKWSAQKDENYHIKNGDPAIYSKQPKGYFSGLGDNLELSAGINLQNYKSYFVPSFNLNAIVHFNSEHYKNEMGVVWEPHFLFAKNAQGNLQTFRNDFITLVMGRQPVKNYESGNDLHFNFFQHLSIGYLVRQKGGFYDDHTFRIGTGGVGWKENKIKLEPLLYFHDFFKGVTPGMRLSINF